MPELYATPAQVPGARSSWFLAQWHRPAYLNPAVRQTGAIAPEAPGLGAVEYGWATPDQSAELQVYAAADGSSIFHLRSSNGVLQADGGANLFLQSDVTPGTTFATPLTYSVQARISEASVQYNSLSALFNRAVLGAAFTGFSMTFNAPGSALYRADEATYSGFMQIGMTDSGAPTPPTYRGGSIDASGTATLISTTVLPGDHTLAFAPQSGALTTLTYNLNAYFADFVSHTWTLAGPGGNSVGFTPSAAAHDGARWTLNSIYIGLETQNAIGAPVAQGAVTMGIDIGHVALTAGSVASSAAVLPVQSALLGAAPVALAPALPNSHDSLFLMQADGSMLVTNAHSGAQVALYAAGTASAAFGDTTLFLDLPTATAHGLAPQLLRDYDGNDLGQAGGWQLMGVASVVDHGAASYILQNAKLGRWAEVQPDAAGHFNMADHGAGGSTRVVGIYEDPTIKLGLTVKGSPTDSQTRFANDLTAGRLRLLGSADFDGDGYKDCFFKATHGLADHSADIYLRGIMWGDGNIQYANYMNASQFAGFMTSHNVASGAYAAWQSV